jgi:F-type H+-transporting ATPase subunit b
LILAASSEEPSGVDLLLPDYREAIPAAIAFIIVFWLMWKFAIPQLNETLEKRAAAVKADLEAAEQSKVEAEKIRRDYEEQLATARDEANRIVEEARQTGEEARQGIVAKAEEDATGIRDRASAELEGERERVAGQLKDQVAALSLDVAEKVVGRSLDRDSQQQLVDQFIDELGGVEG